MYKTEVFTRAGGDMLKVTYLKQQKPWPVILLKQHLASVNAAQVISPFMIFAVLDVLLSVCRR